MGGLVAPVASNASCSAGARGVESGGPLGEGRGRAAQMGRACRAEVRGAGPSSQERRGAVDLGSSGRGGMRRAAGAMAHRLAAAADADRCLPGPADGPGGTGADVGASASGLRPRLAFGAGGHAGSSATSGKLAPSARASYGMLAPNTFPLLTLPCRPRAALGSVRPLQRSVLSCPRIPRSHSDLNRSSPRAEGALVVNARVGSSPVPRRVVRLLHAWADSGLRRARRG